MSRPLRDQLLSGNSSLLWEQTYQCNTCTIGGLNLRNQKRVQILLPFLTSLELLGPISLFK